MAKPSVIFSNLIFFIFSQISWFSTIRDMFLQITVSAVRLTDVNSVLSRHGPDHGLRPTLPDLFAVLGGEPVLGYSHDSPSMIDIVSTYFSPKSRLVSLISWVMIPGLVNGPGSEVLTWLGHPPDLCFLKLLPVFIRDVVALGGPKSSILILSEVKMDVLSRILQNMHLKSLR